MPGYINLGLPDTPDSNLDPATWEEMRKVYQAAKNIAMALSTNAPTNPAGSKITIQDYAVVYRTAPFAVAAGSVVQLVNDVHYTNKDYQLLTGTIVNSLQLVSTSYPYPTAYTETYVPANTPAPYILLGAVNYPAANLVPGARYYIDYSIAGSISTTGTGRYVGQALAADLLYFDPQCW